MGAESDACVRCAAVRLSSRRNFRAEQSANAALWRPCGGDARCTANAFASTERGAVDLPKVQLLYELSFRRDEATPGSDAGTGQPDSRCIAPPQRTGAVRPAGNLSRTGGVFAE